MLAAGEFVSFSAALVMSTLISERVMNAVSAHVTAATDGREMTS